MERLKKKVILVKTPTVIYDQDFLAEKTVQINRETALPLSHIERTHGYYNFINKKIDTYRKDIYKFEQLLLSEVKQETKVKNKVFLANSINNKVKPEILQLKKKIMIVEQKNSKFESLNHLSSNIFRSRSVKKFSKYPNFEFNDKYFINKAEKDIANLSKRVLSPLKYRNVSTKTFASRLQL